MKEGRKAGCVGFTSNKGRVSKYGFSFFGEIRIKNQPNSDFPAEWEIPLSLSLASYSGRDMQIGIFMNLNQILISYFGTN
jgi:hypothetical protein